MNSKFDTIFESNFNRYQGGGFLTGDVIKLKQDWESSEWAKKAPEQMVSKIKELAGSDLVLRVSAVKALRPSVNSDVNQASGVDDFHLDVTQELAPGFYNGNYVTLPQELVELEDDVTLNLPEVPDSMKREEDVDIKPRELNADDTSRAADEDPMMVDPRKHTGMDDTVNKALPSDNTKLTGATGADSYTAGYMN
jgi:hypothetical protein